MATRNLLFIADDDEVVVRLLSGLTGSHEDVLRRQFEDGGTSSMQVAGDAFSITIFRSSLPPPTPSLSKIYYVTSGLGRHKPQDINVALISNIQKRVDFAVVLADIADARNAARAQPFADRLAQLYKPDCIIYAGDDNYNDLICHMRSPPARIILTKDLPEISRSERSRLEEQIRTISSERDLLKEKNRVLEGQIFEYRRLLRLEQAVQTDNSEPLCPEIADLVRNVVGLRNLKSELNRFAIAQNVHAERRARGVQAPQMVPSMVFLGNPGTGKTTVARIMRDLLVNVKLLPENAPFNELSRDNLVGAYVGSTEALVSKLFQSVRSGGVLFVDEAYRLVMGSTNDFGKIALEAMMTQMTKADNKIVFIFAGYPAEMEHFLSANPGLRSRITYRFNFDDYTPDDLARIFEIQALKAGFALETLASLSEIGRCFQQTFTESERHSSNGRLAEKVFEKVQLVQTNRVAGTARELSLEQLQTITLKDIKQGMDDVKAMGNL